MITPEVKSKSRKGFVEEIADHGNVGIAHCFRNSRRAARATLWGQLVGINEENGCDEKNSCVAGEIIPTKTLMELSEPLTVQMIKFGSCSKPRKE